MKDQIIKAANESVSQPPQAALISAVVQNGNFKVEFSRDCGWTRTILVDQNNGQRYRLRIHDGLWYEVALNYSEG